MWHKSRVLIPSFAFLALTGLAQAQAPTLQEQLAAQYKLTKMGNDSSGASVVDQGTVLAIQKGGIVGTPYKSLTTRTATFQDGTVHASDIGNGKAASIGNKLCGVLHKCPTTPDAAKDENATKLFKTGDKVFATKLEVNSAKDQVTLGIVSCDSCNKVDPPTYNKANVVFQFAKGSLATASAGDIEDTIGQLLTISDDSQQQDQASDQQGQNGGQQGGQQGGGQQAQPSQPQNIQMGMTMDQVQAALGSPEKTVNLGPKQIYVYKDLKVVFINGRVADVQ